MKVIDLLVPRALRPLGITHQVLLSYGGAPAAWTTVASFTTARAWHGAAGLSTAALVFGGETDQTESAFTNSTQAFDGSSWSGGGNMLASRGGLTGCGSSTAALVMAGRTAITTPITTVDSYNGSTWSNTTALTGTRRQSKGCGTATAALNAGGYRDGVGTLSDVQSFNGSSWTSQTSFSVPNFTFGLHGTPTDALKSCGNSSLQSTESYNGSAWTTGQNLITGRGYHGSSGTGAIDGVVAAGYSSGAMSSVEKFTSAWATVASLNAARYACSSVGTAADSLCTGGYDAGSGVRASAERFR